MPMLTGINGKAIVNGVKDEQEQPAGVDLTVQYVEFFKDTEEGRIDYSNEERYLPKREKVVPRDGWYELTQGVYVVTYNEEVKIPNNIAGIVLPRSSLVRIGATLTSGLWDPGYRGKGISLLTIGRKTRIQVNARIGQIIFFELEKAHKLYNGIYMNENL